MRENGGEISRVKRPWGLRWLTLAMLATSLVHVVSAVRALQYTAVYLGLDLSVSTPVLFFRGFVWGGLFLYGAVRLWQLRNGAQRLVLLVVGAFSVFQFVWWGVYIRSDYGQTRFPFAVILTLIVFGLVAWYLNRPQVRILLTGKASGTIPTNTQRQKS